MKISLKKLERIKVIKQIAFGFKGLLQKKPGLIYGVIGAFLFGLGLLVGMFIERGNLVRLENQLLTSTEYQARVIDKLIKNDEARQAILKALTQMGIR